MRSPEATPERHFELASEPWKASGIRTRRWRSCFRGRCHAIAAFRAAGRPWSSEGNQVSGLGKLRSGFLGRCNLPTAFKAASFQTRGAAAPAPMKHGATWRSTCFQREFVDCRWIGESIHIMAEGMGFEPMEDVPAPGGIRSRCIKPCSATLPKSCAPSRGCSPPGRKPCGSSCRAALKWRRG